MIETPVQYKLKASAIQSEAGFKPRTQQLVAQCATTELTYHNVYTVQTSGNQNW